MENFINNKEENIFGIEIKSKDADSFIFILDDFEFKLNLKNCHLSTEEDILIPICEKINKIELKTDLDVILEFSKQYGEEMGEEKPLYEGQDVFEDENDNNDIKFEGRLRLTEESFPSELFVHVLKFLEPSFVCKLSRVSKKWLKLTQLDVLWKEFCKKEGSTDLSEGISRYIDEYRDLLNYSIPKESQLPEQMKIDIAQSPFKAHYFKSNHLYIQILNPEKLNQQGFDKNLIITWTLKDDINNYISQIIPPNLSISWNSSYAFIVSGKNIMKFHMEKSL